MDIDMAAQIHDDVNRFCYILGPILYLYPKVLKESNAEKWADMMQKIISCGHRKCKDEKRIGML